MPKLGRALRGSSIVAKKPTEPLAALDRTASSTLSSGCIDQPLGNSLVIAFAVVVLDVLTDCSSKMRFTDRNDLCQALRFDRSNESLGIRVEIWAAARKPYGTHTRTGEDFSEALREERIAVVNEVAATKQETASASVRFRAI